MQINVQVKGIRRVNKIVRGLGRELQKEILNKSEKFNSFVQKSAKLRAPRSTGELAQSIRVFRKGNEIHLIVGSPYGRYQEFGFRPHWVHALMPTKNKLGTIGAAFNVSGFVFVSKHTPFIQPALESGMTHLPIMLSDGVKQAIRNSGGGK